jgi:tetratricopeptide (TPR) repeat protein
MRHFFMLLGFALWVLLAGCGDRDISRGEPFYRRGMTLEASQNYPEAIQAYLQCVGRQPDHVAACYRLAYLNDNQIKDGTELALHYYRRYLELDPHGKEAQTVRRRIEALQQQWLGKLAAAYPDMLPKAWDKKLTATYITKAEAQRQRQQLERQIDALRTENVMLRQRQEVIANKTVPEPGETTTPAPAKEPEPAESQEPGSEPAPTVALPGVLRFHLVQPNDNLSSISRKYYGSIRHWRVILEHNKALLRGSEKNLQPGMRLEIPPLDEKPAVPPDPVG